MPMSNDQDQNGQSPINESTGAKSLLAVLAKLQPLEATFPLIEDPPLDQTRVLL
jgi:hypothetical protein